MTGLKRREIVASFERHFWSTEAPSWSKDTLNGDQPCQCGECGAWMEVVRTGKVQCVACDWATPVNNETATN